MLMRHLLMVQCLCQAYTFASTRDANQSQNVALLRYYAVCILHTLPQVLFLVLGCARAERKYMWIISTLVCPLLTAIVLIQSCIRDPDVRVGAFWQFVVAVWAATVLIIMIVSLIIANLEYQIYKLHFSVTISNLSQVFLSKCRGGALLTID